MKTLLSLSMCLLFSCTTSSKEYAFFYSINMDEKKVEEFLDDLRRSGLFQDSENRSKGSFQVLKNLQILRVVGDKKIQFEVLKLWQEYSPYIKYKEDRVINKGDFKRL